MERKYVIENTEGRFYCGDGQWCALRRLATEYSWDVIPPFITGTDGEEWEWECVDYRPDDPDIRYYPEGSPDGADSSAVVRVVEE